MYYAFEVWDIKKQTNKQTTTKTKQSRTKTKTNKTK